MLHGAALLLGTVAVLLGFIGGLLYLWQSRRLKQKTNRLKGLRLPSLERLQRVSEGALITSCCLLVIGLVSGILLNWWKGADAAVPWTDPVVWPSAVLLMWLLLVLTFNAFYKPARQGRKVAYLTMASFMFLAFVIAILFLVPSSHGGPDESFVRAATREWRSHGPMAWGGRHAA
jgi:ABC-type transport system involved in cytochrome c biogenesis permease subunit